MKCEKRKFLLFPKRIDGKVRWLRMVTVVTEIQRVYFDGIFTYVSSEKYYLRGRK